MSTSVTRLVLVRHGESASNAGGWISSVATCGGLTDRGRAQATALRDRLATDATLVPDVVLSSTMRRARETAAIVAPAWDAPVDAWPDLGERDPGECAGLSHGEYEARYGVPPYREWERPMSPGGESHAEFLGRIESVHARILAEYAGRTVVAVCHGGVIVGSALALTGTGRPAPGAPLPWVNPAHTSISEWVHGGFGAAASWRTARYNDHGHLAALARA